MASLLKNDYNAAAHKDCLSTKKIKKISIPKGRIGMEIEDTEDGFFVNKFLDDCKIKKKLNLGDQLVKLNNTLLSKLSLEEVQLLFIKNQNSKRTLGIYMNS